MDSWPFWFWACRTWSWPTIYGSIWSWPSSIRPPIKGTDARAAGFSFFYWNLRGAAARFLKPHFSVFSLPRKQAKPCRRILSTIDTTPSCCRSHLPLHHISLDRECGVIGVLHVCITRRCCHLRRWIGSDHEERRLVWLHHPRSVERFRCAISSRVWRSYLSLLLITSPRLDLGFLVRIRRKFFDLLCCETLYKRGAKLGAISICPWPACPGPYI
jgi:hypothetical protein